MGNKNIRNKKNLKEIRQTLRHNLTPAEAKLWKALKNKNLKGLQLSQSIHNSKHATLKTDLLDSLLKILARAMQNRQSDILFAD